MNAPLGARATTSRPLWQFTARALRDAFLQGRATPVEALRSCLERIEAVQPHINAFVALHGAALEEAKASSERYRRGTSRSALDGIPVSIKDNLLTSDMPTTWGSKGLREYRSGHDELAVARLRKAGAIVVGKTNVPEFTLEGYTDNPLFGTTRNPWNIALTPGGSSGGAAASVAAGCTPLALGTDGGGSTRRPAAHCGLFGLKPTIGTIARNHALPTLLLDFEVIGLLARTAEDIETLLSVVGGADAEDPASFVAYGARTAQALTVHGTLRVLYVDTLDNAPVDPAIAQSCEAAVEELASAHGLVLDKGALPLDLRAINAVWPQIGQIGLTHLFGSQPAWRDGASPKYREMAAQGEKLSAAHLWSTLELVAQLRRDCASMFRQWDVIAMPSTAAQPWPAQQAFPTVINGKPVGPRGHAIFTGWANAAGLPGISVPVRPDDQGLPIGVQLISRPGAESLLLGLAADIHSLMGAQERWPEF